MQQIELFMLAGSALILIAILASKISSRLGIPAMLLFLAVGMLAGSEGPGGIHFDDPRLVQAVGIFALAYILFAGGLDTSWSSVRPVLAEGLLLSTVGVTLTALTVGWFAHRFIGFSWLEGLLLGAIVSSTDAAAVFAVLRSRNVHLSGNLKPLLELESGSNDPMAVFLTTGMILLLVEPERSLFTLVPMVVWQMLIGTLAGICAGKAGVMLLNRLRLDYDGLYSVLTLTLVPLVYGLTALAQGNGFLAVYVAGIIMGNSTFVQKRSLLRFHDGLAWLMQITMFLVLGLQVFPSRLVPVAGSGLAMVAVLILVARPLGIFVSLLFSPMVLREKVLVSWVGLRGAVPIVLGTFPLLAGVGNAETIFNIVFFIVLASALLQGSSIPLAARWLRLEASPPSQEGAPAEGERYHFPAGARQLVTVPDASPLAEKQVVDLCLPPGVLIVYIQRGDEYLVPEGSSRLLAGDRLHLLSSSPSPEEIERLLNAEVCPLPGRERTKAGSESDW